MSPRFGPLLLPGGARFRLWAPAQPRVRLLHNGMRRPMERCADGWFEVKIAGAQPGDRYAFALDDLVVPDPASRFQPDGVHEASELVDLRSCRGTNSAWVGRPWEEIVLYELHVGTFTRAGTYGGAVERLDDLRALGVTAVELMPLAQPAGDRNWGYDGVAPFAPARAYGRPEELCAFLDEAHARGLAVFLDVVYNHFGPEGNYLHRLSPEFFTDRHHTPWGSAVNLDGPGSENVRAFFIESALHWLFDYGFDGLRLDAVHELRDDSARPFLRELAARVRAATPPERHVHLVLENDDNAAELLRGPEGFDAQWNDDAHHALHVALTGEQTRYYADYPRPVPALVRTLGEGFAYQGEPSAHREGRPRGTPSAHLPPDAFVDFLQNHDQIGNRAFGERITMLAPWERVRAGAALVLPAPAIPLLFMGEEWAASTPFLFFCNFSGELARAVTEGRRREFAGDPQFDALEARERIPDPNARATFEDSTLRWEERAEPPHREALAFYAAALAARRAHVVPLLRAGEAPRTETAMLGERAFRIAWSFPGGSRLAVHANLGDHPVAVAGLAGETVFATEPSVEEAGARGAMPPWSVLWKIERGRA